MPRRYYRGEFRESKDPVNPYDRCLFLWAPGQSVFHPSDYQFSAGIADMPKSTCSYIKELSPI